MGSGRAVSPSGPEWESALEEPPLPFPALLKVVLETAQNLQGSSSPPVFAGLEDPRRAATHSQPFPAEGLPERVPRHGLIIELAAAKAFPAIWSPLESTLLAEEELLTWARSLQPPRQAPEAKPPLVSVAWAAT